jgi:hypothetical protein
MYVQTLHLSCIEWKSVSILVYYLAYVPHFEKMEGEL